MDLFGPRFKPIPVFGPGAHPAQRVEGEFRSRVPIANETQQVPGISKPGTVYQILHEFTAMVVVPLDNLGGTGPQRDKGVAGISCLSRLAVHELLCRWRQSFPVAHPGHVPKEHLDERGRFGPVAGTGDQELEQGLSDPVLGPPKCAGAFIPSALDVVERFGDGVENGHPLGETQESR